MTRDSTLLWSLWLAVIFMALWVGGTLYQMLVIVPLWTASLPESLRSFLGTDYVHTVLHFFGPPFIAARTAPMVAALVAGWRSAPHRRALSVALGCWLFVIGFTLLYIYPLNDTLFVVGSAQPGDVETRDLLRRWILADQFRFGIGCVSFIALLWAFRLPLPGARESLRSE
jgi:Domain of unknown function (DUF1772)